jgi:hypothetical protein
MSGSCEMMAKYLSRKPCRVCGKAQVFDSEKKTLSCGCLTFGCQFINENDYVVEKEGD